MIKEEEQTVVFAATKHHVEYLNMVSVLPVFIGGAGGQNLGHPEKVLYCFFFFMLTPS